MKGMTTKHRLLAFLKENKGSWVSGEFLSSRMSVSRSALWKHVRTLIKEGYEIESLPRKGYRFRKSPDRLYLEEIREGLTTQWLGQKDIVYYTETDSTNAKAKVLAMEGAEEGSLVIAEAQTDGKGRRGRPWFSPPLCGIYLSIILKPAIPPSETSRLVLLSSVTMADLLNSRTSLTARIKWPNDVIVNKKKIAGILLEAGTDVETVDYCIVGLGLNVNNPEGSFPDTIKNKATSLSIESALNVSRTDLVREYLARFEHYYEEFMGGRGSGIVARWKELTGIVGRRVSVDLSGRIYRGTVTDLDENGALIIRDRSGAVHKVFSGDCSYRI
jgi:BirA family biotin operon repressor/biotin-[acetyl-CoA-carboxylase] ligase